MQLFQKATLEANLKSLNGSVENFIKFCNIKSFGFLSSPLLPYIWVVFIILRTLSQAIDSSEHYRTSYPSSQANREGLKDDLEELQLKDIAKVYKELRAATRDTRVWKNGLDLQYT